MGFVGCIRMRSQRNEGASCGDSKTPDGLPAIPLRWGCCARIKPIHPMGDVMFRHPERSKKKWVR